MMGPQTWLVPGQGAELLYSSRLPWQFYMHCAAHQLNLAVVSACKIQAFKNTETCIGDIARFFKFSAKRQRLLDKAMFHVNTESTAKKLKDVCRTRWIQRVDSYVVFLELLPAIHLTLQAMTCPNQYESLGTDWNWDGETVTKANGFLYQFQSSTFLVCFKILLKFFLVFEALQLSFRCKL